MLITQKHKERVQLDQEPIQNQNPEIRDAQYFSDP